MDYKSIITGIKEILRFKLYCMYIVNAVSLIRTFHLSEQNFEPMNQRGSDKQGCTVYAVLEPIMHIHGREQKRNTKFIGNLVTHTHNFKPIMHMQGQEYLSHTHKLQVWDLNDDTKN